MNILQTAHLLTTYPYSSALSAWVLCEPRGHLYHSLRSYIIPTPATASKSQFTHSPATTWGRGWALHFRATSCTLHVPYQPHTQQHPRHGQQQFTTLPSSSNNQQLGGSWVAPWYHTPTTLINIAFWRQRHCSHSHAPASRLHAVSNVAVTKHTTIYPTCACHRTAVRRLAAHCKQLSGLNYTR